MHPKRIGIVGGGIGGLSQAIALRRVGFDPIVLERSPVLREVGAGVGLWSNALHSLDELGVGDAIRASCLSLRTMQGINAAGKTLSRFDMRELGPEFAEASCRVVLRPLLLDALARKLPHGVVRTNAQVVGVEDRADSVLLELADGSREEFDLVIGADGLHSVVRPFVIGSDRIRYSGQTCIRGIARFRAPQLDVIGEAQGGGQRGAVCPVDENTSYWWVAWNAPPDQPIPVEQRQAFLAERYRGWPLGIPDAIAATAAEVMLQHDLVDRAPVKQYVRGRLALIGDAAHPTTPNLGQGANMAIDDALVLARALKQEASVPAALERYQRERLPRTRLIVQRSWSFGRLCLWKAAPMVALREMMLGMTPKGTMVDLLRWQILENAGELPI